MERGLACSQSVLWQRHCFVKKAVERGSWNIVLHFFNHALETELKRIRVDSWLSLSCSLSECEIKNACGPAIQP